jgi:hypothetical protein
MDAVLICLKLMFALSILVRLTIGRFFLKLHFPVDSRTITETALSILKNK